jgi:hypothetical protein
MTYRWLTGAAPFVSAGGALAQTAAPEPNRLTNGPAGSVDASHAGIVVAPSGTATSTTETFKKTQSYTSGNGLLTAKTHIETTGPVTTTLTK